MRLISRRISPGEFDHELVWLMVSVGAAVIGGVWFYLKLPWPICPFLAMTGYPCLTCGSTRCAIALSQLHFSQAWMWNPLASIALIGIAAFDVYAAIVLVTRGSRLRFVEWTGGEKNLARISVVALIVLNWIYLLAHRGQY
jgi:hypothetical protein